MPLKQGNETSENYRVKLAPFLDYVVIINKLKNNTYGQAQTLPTKTYPFNVAALIGYTHVKLDRDGILIMKVIHPPKTWKGDLATHPNAALSHPWYRIVSELQDGVTQATVNFFTHRGLRNFHFPITTGAISSPMGLGSDSKPVPVKIGDVPTYLADSMQFFLEYGCRLCDKGAYYLQPSFRGEDADARHLCQFYHAEAEIPGTLDGVKSLIQDYLQTMTEFLVGKYESQIVSTAGTLSHVHALLDAKNFTEISHHQASIWLATRGDNHFLKKDPNGIGIITSAGELELLAHEGPFIWLQCPPHSSIPFYQAFHPENADYALCADLLMGIGETVGAGQRHQDASDVLKALARHAVDSEAYRWYIEMREVSPLKTSGFGLGTERYLCWLLQHDDVRDFQIIPRFNGVHHTF